MALLDIRQLDVAIHGAPILDSIGISLDAGEILGVAGESGSGKSVTFSSVMGLVRSPGRIDGGRILRGFLYPRYGLVQSILVTTTISFALVGVFVLWRYLDPHPHAVEAPEFEHDPAAKPLPAGDPYSASEVARAEFPDLDLTIGVSGEIETLDRVRQIVLRGTETGLHATRAFQEKPHAAVAGSLLELGLQRAGFARVRDVQTRNGQEVLVAKVQPNPRGDQELDVGRRLQKIS